MRDDVEIRLLGPCEVIGPRASVALRGAGQRTLTARLALPPGTMVPQETLVDVLWRDSCPATAVKTLHSYLAHLRRALRDAGLTGLIVTHKPGYLLHARPDTVDAVRFVSLATRGRDDLAAGRPAVAARTLRSALRLWRGEAFADCRESEWLSQEATRLDEMRMASVEDLISAELALGGHAKATSELSSLVGRYPFRERLWELLMLALYRSGRQADALGAYQRARSALVAELGIEPGPRLRQLEAAILTADESLDLPADPESHPQVRVGAEVAPGNGAREDVALAPAAPPTQAAGAGLPVEVTSFVGRERETADAVRLLSVSRLVTLVGVGGVGKTRLALHVANRLRDTFAGDVSWVELAGLHDPDLVPHTVADALGVRDQSGRDRLAALADHLRERRLLLVLDNCEHLVSAAAVLADRLLRCCPGVGIVATSRQPLRVDGEQVLAVSPLPVPDPGRPLAGTGAQFASMTLLVQRAAALLHEGFTVTPDNEDALGTLCQRLDGIPLAIELAALRLRTLSPAQLLARFDDRFRLLTGGQRAALPRHQTMRAAIDWSYELCSPAEQALWARLSVFAGGFDLDAAEDVCADDELPFDTVIDLVDGLVDKSVLLREEHAGVMRYRLLETLRQYGRHRLRASGQEDALLRRHRDRCLRLAETADRDWFGPDQTKIAGRMRREHANLRSALEFCLTEPDGAEHGQRLAATLWFFWVGCGFVAEGRYWLDLVLAVDRRPTAARARALWVSGYVACIQGDTRTAGGQLAECQELAESLEDPSTLGYAMFVRGAVAVFTGDLAAGAALLKAADDQHRALGELNSNVIMARLALAMTVAFGGDLEHAVRMCEDARAICEEHGEQWARGYALYVLAFAATATGEQARADELVRACLRIKRQFNDLLGIALSIELLALLAATAGDAERAAVLLGAAHAIWPSVGIPLFGSGHFGASHEQCELLARQALGDSAFRSAFQRGGRLTGDERIAYAVAD